MNRLIQNYLFAVVSILTCLTSSLYSQDADSNNLWPAYQGISQKGVDTSTMTGTVMCGYQGWFNCPNDGSERGWFHWGKGRRFEPARCTIDLWPDMTEYDPDERYPTAFKHKDGSTAYVFSSRNRKTVLRHFRWMEEYGIDGVFVQRFAVQTFGRSGLSQCNTVLDHCRTGANQFGRAYAVMYDLSGLRNNQMQRVIEDWKSLVDKMKITKHSQDKAYLHHNGKPVVAVWGIGFNDGRRYTLEECATLIDFLKNDPRYGGCTIMIGIPTWWRTLNRDTVPDKKLHDVIRKADIVSPWTVGRFRTLDGVSNHARYGWAPDIKWCKENSLEYLPVVFPGFSWHNMNLNSKLDMIPRQKGRFLWQQYVEAQKAGATMIYQAMFDEVDEATAIFKCTNNPPVGASPFLTYEGLPSDYYLRLVGHAARCLRQNRSLPSDPPTSDK
jgi:hypothetical protein